MATLHNLTSQRCTFCGREETPDVWVCSSCTQKLLFFKPPELARGYGLSISKGYKDKAKAIKSFMKEDFSDGKLSTTKRCVNRNRGVRNVGPKKRTLSRFKKH